MDDPSLAAATPTSSVDAEIARLNKIITALIKRAESHASFESSEYGLFETAVVLEGQVRQRTEELEAALRENERLNRDLRQAQDELKLTNLGLVVLSATDALTGLANRRGCTEFLEAAWQRAIRNDGFVGVAMVDIDWFKRYNDQYGHPAGDACLQAVATALRSRVRQAVDLVARYGGEEFLLILPGADPVATRFLAGRARRAVADLRLPLEGTPRGYVTVSVGAAALRPAGQGSPDALISQADAALYEAKRLGRNRIRMIPPTAGIEPRRRGPRIELPAHH